MAVSKKCAGRDGRRRALCLRLGNARPVDALGSCTPAQLAIAWVLSRRPPLVALAGTSKRKWLEENAKAAELKPKVETLQALDAAFRPGIAQGTRYPAPMMARLGL
jgi:aryl-alcohol dehydrogenase-like predicted oxidoreductase